MGLVRVPFKVLCPVALVPPVKPPVTVGAFQLYVVPEGTIIEPPVVKVLLNGLPLHLVSV